MFGFSNVSLTWSLADLHTAEEIEHSLICQSSFLVAHNTELLFWTVQLNVEQTPLV